jgi:hypothetical protein
MSACFHRPLASLIRATEFAEMYNFPSPLTPVKWLLDLTGQGRRRWENPQQLTLRKRQKPSILWLQGANPGILLPEGLSRFAFRRPFPVECLPNEMQCLFHWGDAYSSLFACPIAPEDGTGATLPAL